MDVLDADDEPLYSRKYKKYMSADIVQFVPFSEFKNDPRLLAKEVLEEIPGQFLNFMEKNNIVPKQVLEAEKRKIKHKLNNQRSIKSVVTDHKEAPEFFAKMQENFVNKALELGLEYTEVTDFIEDKGLAEASHDLLLDALNNRNYQNKIGNRFKT